jgi:hypothetical protein
MKRITFTIITLLLIAAQGLHAQETFRYFSPVNPVKQNTYYDVLLPPSVTCLLEPGFGNLRLRDSLSQEVPFIMKSEDPKTETMAIEWLPKVQAHYWAHWYSRCFFSNPKAELLDRMVLRIRNADVQQRFWLSGSDDMNEWYIIKEDYAYDAAYNPDAGSNLVTIHFPPVDYKYFKVELRHFWREPIQIMGAGIYRFDGKEGRFMEIPALEAKQSEAGQESVVEVPLGGKHYLDRVYFEIDGPELYHREAKLEGLVGDMAGTWQTLHTFALTSTEEGMVSLENIRASKLRLRISNQDDRPLKVAGVRAWQTRKYMVARMESGQSYGIWIGDADLRAAKFDLAHFEGQLPKNREVVHAGAPEALSPSAAVAANSRPGEKAEPEEAAKPFFESPAFLWGAIGLVVLLVGWMAVRMLRDMKPGSKDSPS